MPLDSAHLSSLNIALVFAIPVVMLGVGALMKVVIEGLSMEAFCLGLEGALVALTECLNRMRAAVVHKPDVLVDALLMGVGMLLACIVALLVLAVIDKGLGGTKRTAWYVSPWLWRLSVGNFMGLSLLVGVLYLMRET